MGWHIHDTFGTVLSYSYIVGVAEILESVEKTSTVVNIPNRRIDGNVRE